MDNDRFIGNVGCRQNGSQASSLGASDDFDSSSSVIYLNLDRFSQAQGSRYSYLLDL